MTQSKKPVHMLLLVGDRIGANCMMGSRKLSILDKFRKYGWQITLAGTSDHVSPCPYAAGLGAKRMPTDRTLDSIASMDGFDAVSVLPGPSHEALIASPRALALLREADDLGRVISGWCRGVRVLAAAGVLRGKRVVGHEDDAAFIEQAGGVFVGQDHPPITEGHIVTGARSYTYRAKNADAIREAVRARQT